MNTRPYILIFPLLWMFLIAPVYANDEWQLVDQYEGIDLYKKIEEAGDNLPFRAVAKLPIAYQEIVMVLIDSEAKYLWAPKLKSTIVHSEITSNEFEFSEYYSTPWPFSDRQFLLLGKVKYNQNHILFTAQNSPNTELASDNHVLVDIKTLTIKIVPLIPDTTRLEFTFSGNMGGWIPDFVQTIIQKKWPVRFIQSLEKRIESGVSLTTPRYNGLIKKSYFPEN